MPDNNEEKEKAAVVKPVKPVKAKMVKFADSECTAMRYAAMTGLNKNTKFWIQKKYPTKDVRKALVWAEELLKEGAISEKPEILNQMVPASK